MSLLSEIEEALEVELGPLSSWPSVLDLRVGIYLAGVVLEGGGAGIAYLPRLGEQLPWSHALTGDPRPRPGALREVPVGELLAVGRQENPVLQTVAMAIRNALSSVAIDRQPRPELLDAQGKPAPPLELLSPRADDTVGVVGAMVPYLAQLGGMVRNIHLFEREAENLRQECRQWLRPAEQMAALMPECTVVIITGAALANQSLDSILPFCGGAREVAVVGPSASVIPEPLFRRGVTLLGGIEVVDPELALRVISEGGSGRALDTRCARKRSFHRSLIRF